MKLTSESLTEGAPIDGEFAFCVPDAASHVAMAPNRNPQLAWTDVPEGTKSFAVLCIDDKVPSKPDDVNQEGREVPADLPRVDFSHWVLVDLPADTRAIAAGAHCDGITARGKDASDAPLGRHGINDYTGWFAGDADMEGQYFGYDGPCPPWNDSLVHEYAFTVYALDVETLPVNGAFTASDVAAAMVGHVLGSASITCTYTLNPRLR